jgi:hypothetical protein
MKKRQSSEIWFQAAIDGDHQLLLEFLENSFDPNTIEYSDKKYRCNALIRASAHGQLECVKILLDHGADIEGTESTGCSALQCAIYYQHPSVVEYLLSRGANINHQDMKRKTPLMFCARNANHALFSLLLKYNPDVNLEDHLGKSIVDYLVYHKWVNELEFILHLLNEKNIKKAKTARFDLLF